MMKPAAAVAPRRKLIAANWKMAGSRERLTELDAIAIAAGTHRDVDVVICPPFTLIEPAASRQPALAIGAQDCHEAVEGAFTGCISATMLRESGATHVILGHSERRAGQGESDAVVRAKSKTAIAAGMTALVCVGESETERLAGKAEQIVMAQVDASVTKYARPETIVVAYEPRWAIGTGHMPTQDEISAIHAAIRQTLCRKLGSAIGNAIRILYGGSVKPGNAADLLAVDNVDGLLVGGASLVASQFVPIIEAAAHA